MTSGGKRAKAGRKYQGLTQIINIPVTPEMKVKLEKLTQRMGKSISSVVRGFLEKELRENSMSDPGEKKHQGLTELINIPVTKEFKAELRAFAQSNNRTLSAVVREFIGRNLDEACKIQEVRYRIFDPMILILLSENGYTARHDFGHYYYVDIEKKEQFELTGVKISLRGESLVRPGAVIERVLEKRRA